MQLVDRHRQFVRVGGGTPRHPVAVMPLVGADAHDRRGRRRDLGLQRHRVGLHHPRARAGEDLELVDRAGLEVGHEQLPHARRAHAAHRVAGAVPPVELPDDAHGTGARRPHGERGSANGPGDAPVLAIAGAEALPEFFVAALGDEVQVELADGGCEAVGVVARPLGVAVVLRADAVVGGTERCGARPDTVPDVFELHSAAVGEHSVDRVGERASRADHGERTALLRHVETVLAQHRMRIGMTTLGDRGELVVGDDGCGDWFRHACPFSRAGCARGG